MDTKALVASQFKYCNSLYFIFKHCNVPITALAELSPALPVVHT